jgi:hypothetical protein
MSARKNHYHEGGTDCQRGHGADFVADNRASDGQNQKEGPNKFSDELLKISGPRTSR